MTVQQAPGIPALLLPAVPKAWYALSMLHGDPEGIYKDTGVGLLPMVTKICHSSIHQDVGFSSPSF